MDSKGYQEQSGNQYGGFTPISGTNEPPPQYMPQRQAEPQQYGQSQYGQQQYVQPQYRQPQYGQPQFAAQNVTVLQTGQVAFQTPPHDYTTQAFIACLCCFWPTGIFAIIKANESRKAVAVGDYARAHSEANSARTLVRVSYGIGILCIIVSVALPVIFYVIMASTVNY